MSCRRALQVHVENLGGGVSETRVMKTTFTRPLNGNVDIDLDFSFVANESEFSSPARAAFLGLTPDGDDLEGKTFIALIVEKDGRSWGVRQIVDDPAGDHDWSITATVDLDECDEAGELVLRTTSFARLDG